MVKFKQRDYLNTDGTVNISYWLDNVATKLSDGELNIVKKAYELSHCIGSHTLIPNTFKTCLELGLEMAALLFDLCIDHHILAAAILYYTIQYTELTLDIVTETLGTTVTQLIQGAQQMNASHILLGNSQLITERNQLDNLRKMMLAMVKDPRVVILKLAERTVLLRIAASMDITLRQAIANEVLHIYAPLANRLGIRQLRWELEDLGFYYLHPKIYKDLAKKLDTKRLEREAFIQTFAKSLSKAIREIGITDFQVTGRAKHIFSIYRKMQRKNVSYEQIYDASAVRVLVHNLEHCYAVLSCVHSLWEHLPDEFDDYIAHPKMNGYRSLHTAIMDAQGRNVEVQIRTYDMHQESELGFAAHWKYKEGNTTQSSTYESKIAWLRSVLEWQHALVSSEIKNYAHEMQAIFGDRIYVFTPKGEIIDLPKGATPLDFAYYIHSEIGHRCKGAKVNGQIAPLTYGLSNGEHVEILTRKIPKPSRDWLNPHSKYVITSRAKAKIQQYFRKLEYEKYLTEGYKIIEHEIKRLNQGIHIHHINFNILAEKFHLQSTEDLFTALGKGKLKVKPIMHAIKELLALKNIQPDPSFLKKLVPARTTQQHQAVEIEGVSNILITFAGCCKPIPGDHIIGFITQGRGISTHRHDCTHIVKTPYPERLIPLRWTQTAHVSSTYPVDLYIMAHHRQNLVRDILTILATQKISLLAMRTYLDETNNQAHLKLHIKLPDISSLEYLLATLAQSPDILQVSRSST